MSTFKKFLTKSVAILLVMLLYIGNITIAVPESGISEWFMTAYAATSGTCGDNLTWELDDEGTLTISGTGAMMDYSSESAPWRSSRSSVKKVTMEGEISNIGSYAFYRCDRLTTVNIPDNVNGIGECAFWGCSLTDIIIPESVTSIGNGAFSYNDLTSATIYGNITNVGHSLFSENSKLQNVTIFYGMTSIGESMFISCVALETIEIPNSVTKICRGAFEGCRALSAINIPDSVTTIEFDAFHGCHSLKEISISKYVEFIDADSFGYCINLAAINVDSKNPYYASVDGVLFDKSLTTLWSYPAGGATVYEMPQSVKSIAHYAFANCIMLKEILFADTVSSISYYSFVGCDSLTDIMLPVGLASINPEAFPYCDNLTHINVDPDNKYFSSIDGVLFDKSTSKLILYPGNSPSYTIPDGVKEIGEYVFLHCDVLTNITLPRSITNINENAFNDRINHVHYGGSDLDWAAVTISTRNDRLSSATVHYRSTSCGDMLEWSISDNTLTVSQIEIEGSVSNSDLMYDWTTGYMTPWYDERDTVKEIFIEDGVANIGDYAFDGFDNLRYIHIPGSVTDISDSAIEYNEKTTIVCDPYSYAEQWAIDNGFRYIHSLYNTVNLRVVDPSGNEVTDGYDVNWYVSGRVAVTGNTFDGHALESDCSYEIVLDETLGTTYSDSGRLMIYAGTEETEITYTLQPIEKVQVSGTIKNRAGKAIDSATVEFTQLLNDRYSETISCTTDADGKYSIELYQCPADMTVTASGYYDAARNNVGARLVGNSSVDLGTVSLIPVPADKLTISMSYSVAVRPDEKASVVALPISSEVNFELTDLTLDKDITDISVELPYIKIKDSSVVAGNTLRLTATPDPKSLEPATSEAIVDESGNAAFDIVFKELGGFDIDAIVSGENNEYIARIFDSNGNLVERLFGSDSLSCRYYPDGTYTVILTEANDLLYGISSVEIMEKFDLKEGTDYASVDVTVSAGKITVIDSVTVPALVSLDTACLDEYSFVADKEQVVDVQNVCLRAEYKLSDEYSCDAASVYFFIPEGLTVVEESVTVNGEAAEYTITGNQLVVDTDSNEAIVRFYVNGSVASYNCDAMLMFSDGENRYAQPIGTASFETVAVTVNVPSLVNKTSVTITGKAVAKTQVTVYDNGNIAGTAKSNAVGDWSIKVNLSDPGDISQHSIFAAVIINDNEHRSAVHTLVYDGGVVELSKITMINTIYPGRNEREQKTVFNFQNGSTRTPSYKFWPERPKFTFVVEFTNNDPDIISDVQVVSTDRYGRKTYIDCTYDENSGKWIGTHYFYTNSSGAIMPVNVTATYKEAKIQPQTLLSDTLTSVVDINTDTFSVERYYANDISSHGAKGMFGLGWYSNLEMTAIHGTDDDGQKYIAVSTRTDAVVYLEEDGVYYNALDSVNTASLVDGKAELYSNDGLTIKFNSDGRIGSIDSCDGKKLSFEYENGNLNSITADNGQQMTFSYTNGLVSEISGEGKMVAYTYDGDYLVAYSNSSGTTTYDYITDSYNADICALTSIVYPDDSYFEIAYDDYGRIVGVGDEKGRTTYEYIGALTVKVTDAEGTSETREYDTIGNLVSMTNDAGHKVTYEYDEDFNVTSIDYSGLLTRDYTYDENGRVLTQSSSNGNTESFTYDDNGNLSSITDANGNKTEYAWNDLGLMTDIVYCDGSTNSIVYDDSGKTVAAVDRAGNEIKYEYDGEQLKSVTYHDGSSVSYSYDDKGRITQIVEETEITRLTYTDNSVELTTPEGRTTKYEYDDKGRTSAITDSEGNTIRYIYDNTALLEIVDENGEQITSYEYNADGMLARQNNANGTYTQYTYTDGALTGIHTYGANGEILSKFVYTYNAFGVITQMEDENGVWKYEYDELQQLISSTDPDGSKTEYEYDNCGNRVSVSVNGDVSEYTSNALNQYTSVDGSTYEYGANGNLSEVTDENGNVTVYSYNAKGYLVSVESEDHLYEYEYDVFGNRDKVTIDGETTEYVYSPLQNGELLNAYYSDGSASSYVQGKGITAQEYNGEFYFYSYNVIGSTADITDGDGDVANSYSYTADGNVSSRTETIENPFTYVGMYGVTDDESGLYHVRARYVNTDTMSFTTPDPAAQTYDINIYRYCGNNPVSYIDVTGEVVLTTFLIGVGISIVANVGSAVVMDVVEYAVTGEYPEDAGARYLGAAADGFISGTATVLFGPAGTVVGSAIGSAAGNIVEGCVSGDGVDASDLVLEMGVSALTAGITTNLPDLKITHNGKPFTEHGYMIMNTLIEKGELNWGSKAIIRNVGKTLTLEFLEEVVNDATENNIVQIFKLAGGSYAVMLEDGTIVCEDGTIIRDGTLPVGVRPIWDPSGYIYEAVPSNRIEGATVTCYYADENGNPVIWDAENYSQVNPLISDVDGTYAWDVPLGEWQVKCELDGYETAYSEWLPVPPPQTEVHLGLISKSAPVVDSVLAYEDGIDITFSMYMDMDSINGDTVIVKSGDTLISGTIKSLNAETDDIGTGETFASRFRFVPDQDAKLSGTIAISIIDVLSYCGVKIASDYSASIDVKAEPKKVETASFINLSYGDKTTINFYVTPAEAGSGLTINIENLFPSLISVDKSSVVTDENGKATIEVSGILPGSAAVAYSIAGTGLQGEVWVDVANINEEVEDNNYSVTPNIVAGASKLYEPWGLRYFATYTGEDADHIANRGIAILKDEFYNESMTAEEFCANEKVHIFTTAQDNLDYETSSERYYATLTKGIYSYDIASLYYVVPFAEMDNGQVIYGTIKKNSMEKILKANLGSSIITAAEKAVCTCILDLKDTVAKHYAANGVPMAENEQVIARGADQTAAPAVKTTSDAGVTPNIVAGASRMIEPWGLRYRATYTGANTADISEYGMVILRDKYYDSTYATAPDKMRTNANAYVYTYENGNGTLEYSSADGRYSAILTEGVTSKDIADVYYVVPFVVLSDGSYVYGAVKSNSMLKIMNTNLGLASVSATEKAVTQDIIDLYNAVKAYYAS